jgi:NTP pyrophosphatase (non-canonical NTP hydrolase)
MSTDPADYADGDYHFAIRAEYKSARRKFPKFHSAHEGYAVLKEEVDEMWDAIKRNDIEQARREAVQVGAMALAFLEEVKP